MATHVKVLGALHLVFGALGVIGALIALAFFGGLAGIVGMDHDPDARISIPILGAIGGFIFIILLIISLPSIIAGIGLLQFRPWARILTLIISAIDLLHVPFGTILGFYGFWVLLSREGEQLFVRAPATPARL
jgi:hypothetical protein